MVALLASAAGQAGTVGKWTTLPNTMPINPVHAALLRNGKVLIVSGSGNDPTVTTFTAGVWDPATGTTSTQVISWDMFCNGMVVLPDGRPFINGGNLQYDPFHGYSRSSIYDPSTNSFVDAPLMAHGRWYPTVTLLGDGTVMTFSGLDETSATNTTVEIYTPGVGWSQQYASGWTPPLYPWLHVLPNGNVFYSGPSATTRLFNTTTHTWSTVATTLLGSTRTYGSSVLLPLTPANNYKPRVMIFGGGNPSTNKTEIIDLSAGTPAWTAGPNMSQPRIEMNAVMLPTGKILALGGSLNDEDTTTASLNADLFDPNTNTMTSAGANAFARLYHSVALLLPDATVWFAGGNPVRGSYQNSMEIYSPAYLFNADGTAATRPTISSAPSTLNYGAQFTVQSPDAANISSVVLVRNGATTHAFNMDQRLVGLSFTPSSGTLTVTAPPNSNIAPPGYYMLFLLNSSGVPSKSTFVQVMPATSDFTIGASPGSQTVPPGATAGYNVTITPSGGFTGTVALGASGLPAGTTATFSPASITATGSSTMNLNTSTSTPTGTYTVTVTGTSGSVNHSTTVTMVVSGSASGLPNYTAGFSGPGMTLNGTAAMSGTRIRLTNGGTHQAGSAFFNTPVNVQNFTTDFSFQITNPSADGMTFTIQGVGPSALGPAGGGLGYGPDTPGLTPGIGKSVAIKFDIYNNNGETADSTGMYTNGVSPTTPSVDMTSSGVNLKSGDAFNVHTTYDGTTLTMKITDATTAKSFTTSWAINIPTTVGGNTAYVGFTAGTGGLSATHEIVTWTYTNSGTPTAATPTFSPAPGAYTGSVNVTLSDTTPGAVVHCTTDGTTATASSPVCTTINVTATTTISAIATATGYNNSTAATGTYTINATPTAATPTFSPAPGTYTGSVNVTLSDTTPGAVVHCSTTGTATASSPVCTSVNATATTTISAIATATGYNNSAVATGTYTITATPTAATPTFSPSPGTYSSSVTVNLSDTTPGAVVHCTTDGSTVTASSPTCTSVIVVATTTINAIATATGYNNSAVATGTYTITSGAPLISYGSGFTSTGLKVNGSAALNGTRLRLTNGGSNQAASAYYTTKVNVQSFTTDFSFQLTNPSADGMTLVIQNNATTTIGPAGGGLGYGPDAPGGTAGIKNSVAVKFDIYNNNGEGANSTGMYQNGASPTTPSTSMTGTIDLHSGHIFNVHMTYAGTTLTMKITDASTGANFTTSWTVNIPTVVGATTAYVGFTGGTGGLSSTQEVINWTYTSP